MSEKSIAGLVFSSAALFAGSSDTLAVGDSAPDFTLHGSDGDTYQLGHYKGKQPVVLAWFPRAFTPG